MDCCDELLRCIISPRVTQSIKESMWMSHDLVIVLKCCTITIIYTTLLSCSYSCHLFKLMHIITDASVLAWISLLKIRRGCLLLHHLQNMAFLVAALGKRCKICRPQKKKMWHWLKLEGSLAIVSFNSAHWVHFSDCNSPQVITPPAGWNWSRWTCLDWSPTPTRASVKVILNQKRSSGCSLTELINQYLGDLFASNLCWALLCIQPLYTCLFVFFK